MKKIAILLMVLFVVTSANFVNAQKNLPTARVYIEHIPDRITFDVGGVTFLQIQSEDGSLIITPNEELYDFCRIATTMGLTVRANCVFLKSELSALVLPNKFKQTFAQEKAKELDKIAKLQVVSEQEKALEMSLEEAENAILKAKDKNERKLKEGTVKSTENMLTRTEERRETKLAKAIREHENNEAEREMKAMDLVNQLDAMEELDAHYLLSGYNLKDKNFLPDVLKKVKRSEEHTSELQSH